jgi:hypothetical protein
LDYFGSQFASILACVADGLFADLKAEDGAALKVEIMKTRRMMAVIKGSASKQLAPQSRTRNCKPL